MGEVLCHVDGASGSGKTTLADKLQQIYPKLIVRDLDDFDDDAVAKLGWTDIPKKDYTDEMLSKLAVKRQRLMDDFINQVNKPMVLVGHAREGDHVIQIPTHNRFLLDVDAKTSAMRALKRSQHEDPKFRRTKEELPEDIKEAQEDIDWLLDHSYKATLADQVIEWVGNQLGSNRQVGIKMAEIQHKVGDIVEYRGSEGSQPSPPHGSVGRVVSAYDAYHPYNEPGGAPRLGPIRPHYSVDFDGIIHRYIIGTHLEPSNRSPQYGNVDSRDVKGILYTIKKSPFAMRRKALERAVKEIVISRGPRPPGDSGGYFYGIDEFSQPGDVVQPYSSPYGYQWTHTSKQEAKEDARQRRDYYRGQGENANIRVPDEGKNLPSKKKEIRITKLPYEDTVMELDPSPYTPEHQYDITEHRETRDTEEPYSSDQGGEQTLHNQRGARHNAERRQQYYEDRGQETRINFPDEGKSLNKGVKEIRVTRQIDQDAINSNQLLGPDYQMPEHDIVISQHAEEGDVHPPYSNEHFQAPWHYPDTPEGLDAARAHAEQARNYYIARGQQTNIRLRVPRKEKALDNTHKYGCLMAILPKDIAKEITTWAEKNIWDEHLTPAGRENKLHVTIKYGFAQDIDMDSLRGLLTRNGPLSAKIVGMSLFKNNEDGDVLKLDIYSPDLHEINRTITGAFRCVNKYPKYNPHITIAYLNPAYSHGYSLHKPPFIDKEITITQAEYSSADGKTEKIPLKFGRDSKAYQGEDWTPGVRNQQEAANWVPPAGNQELEVHDIGEGNPSNDPKTGDGGFDSSIRGDRGQEGIAPITAAINRDHENPIDPRAINSPVEYEQQYEQERQQRLAQQREQNRNGPGSRPITNWREYSDGKALDEPNKPHPNQGVIDAVVDIADMLDMEHPHETIEAIRNHPPIHPDRQKIISTSVDHFERESGVPQGYGMHAGSIAFDKLHRALRTVENPTLHDFSDDARGTLDDRLNGIVPDARNRKKSLIRFNSNHLEIKAYRVKASPFRNRKAMSWLASGQGAELVGAKLPRKKIKALKWEPRYGELHSDIGQGRSYMVVRDSWDGQHVTLFNTNQQDQMPSSIIGVGTPEECREHAENHANELKRTLNTKPASKALLNWGEVGGGHRAPVQGGAYVVGGHGNNNSVSFWDNHGGRQHLGYGNRDFCQNLAESHRMDSINQENQRRGQQKALLNWNNPSPYHNVASNIPGHIYAITLSQDNSHDLHYRDQNSTDEGNYWNHLANDQSVESLQNIAENHAFNQQNNS